MEDHIFTPQQASTWDLGNPNFPLNRRLSHTSLFGSASSLSPLITGGPPYWHRLATNWTPSSKPRKLPCKKGTPLVLASVLKWMSYGPYMKVYGWSLEMKSFFRPLIMKKSPFVAENVMNMGTSSGNSHWISQQRKPRKTWARIRKVFLAPTVNSELIENTNPRQES